MLALEYLCVYMILLLGPKQFISMELSPGICIRVDLPPCDELMSGYLLHGRSWFLVLVGGGLESALGGIGALGHITWSAQTLGPGVTTGIGAANIGIGATTSDTNTRTRRKHKENQCKSHKKQMTRVERIMRKCYEGTMIQAVVLPDEHGSKKFVPLSER